MLPAEVAYRKNHNIATNGGSSSLRTNLMHAPYITHGIKDMILQSNNYACMHSYHHGSKSMLILVLCDGCRRGGRKFSFGGARAK
jgi:hypothetical protein